MKFFINLDTKPKFTRPELLYHPPIPAPLHGINPRTIMGQKEWDVVRREVYAKNNDCCWACGVHRSVAPVKKWLEAHELYDIDYKKGRMRLIEIVALCRLCHNYVHITRLRALADKGRVSLKYYNRVLAHGQDILRRTHAQPWYDWQKALSDLAKYKVPWNSWYLEYNGRKYRSQFKGPDDWVAYYDKQDKRK